MPCTGQIGLEAIVCPALVNLRTTRKGTVLLEDLSQDISYVTRTKPTVLMCSSSLQAPAMGRNVSLETVDGRTRKLCSGVPTRTTNVDHLPSSPSKYCDGANEIGAAVVAARGALSDDILVLGGQRRTPVFFRRWITERVANNNPSVNRTLRKIYGSSEFEQCG